MLEGRIAAGTAAVVEAVIAETDTAVAKIAVADTAAISDAAASAGNATGTVSATDWREIDRRLRRVASAQAALDAEELRWLALAQEIELHRELGMASMLEYVERVLGHGPKAGHERLRVARDLRELPLTRAELEQGRLSFSAVRELSRKVTAKTEAEWLARVQGKCLREIEDLLSGHKKGDRPGDPIDPDLQLRKITLELTPPTLALFREACRRLEDELGHHLTDDETMAAMCATVVGGESPREDMPDDRTVAGSPRDDRAMAESPRVAGAIAESPREDGATAESPREDGAMAESPREACQSVAAPHSFTAPIVALPIAAPPIAAPAAAPPSSTRAKPESRLAPYQIALTVCPSCERGWHDAGGRAIAVPDSTIAQAICDAQYLGLTDASVAERAYQEVSPATARMVVRRDRGCCQVPGCRSARWLQIHHIVWREHGGSNDPRNLVCLCFAHHQAVHQGKIGLTGTAPELLVFDLRSYRDDPAAAAPSTAAKNTAVTAVTAVRAIGTGSTVSAIPTVPEISASR
jgi:hypothetical protein